jgi:dipeptidyl aminopeptidase/acylaminoacyl peptidase
MNRQITLLFLSSLMLLGSTGCSSTPAREQGQNPLIHWSQQLTQAPLQLQLEWVKPMRPGPHPTVIVHPGRGEVAADMIPVLDALAAQGYLAVAVDYLRLIHAEYTATTFPWRDHRDSQQALEMILSNPLVDRERVATLGFSLGGAHSLLLAANNPTIRTVVTYYPMSDFPNWVAERRSNPLWSMLFAFMRWNYNAESARNSDASHQQLLASYSAINQVEKIRVPVLVIHGDKDGIAPLQDSRRLVRALSHNNTPSELLVIHDVGHGFNLTRSEQTTRSWNASLAWLKDHLAIPGQPTMTASTKE